MWWNSSDSFWYFCSSNPLWHYVLTSYHGMIYDVWHGLLAPVKANYNIQTSIYFCVQKGDRTFFSQKSICNDCNCWKLLKFLICYTQVRTKLNHRHIDRGDVVYRKGMQWIFGSNTGFYCNIYFIESLHSLLFFRVNFFYKYIDDSNLSLPEYKKQELLDTFNSFRFG